MKQQHTLEDIYKRCEPKGSCMIWQQSCNGAGYPQTYFEGRGGVLVRRIVAELSGIELGELTAGAKCGNRLCVSAAHIVPRTIKQVARAASRRGTLSSPSRRIACFVNARKKLTWDQVNEIRAEALVCRQRGETLESLKRRLAERYKVAEGTIRSVIIGRTWATHGCLAPSSVFDLGRRS